MRLFLALAAVIIGVGLAPSPASAAGAPPSPALSTTILDPYVPPGWKPSTVKFDSIVAELGEFTPSGAPTEQFTDLVGYTISPQAASANPPTGAAFLAQIVSSAKAMTAQRCSASTVREHKPPVVRDGWVYLQLFCVLKSGAAAGQVDLTFQAARLEPHNLFTVWRAWRGSPADFSKLLHDKASIDADGVTPLLTFDEAVVDRAVDPLLVVWADVFARVEVCDLAAGQICPRYRAKSPAMAAIDPAILADPARKAAFRPSTTQSAEILARLSNGAGSTPAGDLVGVLEIAGSHELTRRQAAEALSKMSGANGEMGKRLLTGLDEGTTDAGKPTGGIVLNQSVTPANHDFSVPAGYVAASLQPWLGARSDGGTLVVMNTVPPIDPQTRARLQAYMVKIEHMSWGFAHISPERITLSLYPAP